MRRFKRFLPIALVMVVASGLTAGVGFAVSPGTRTAKIPVVARARLAQRGLRIARHAFAVLRRARVAEAAGSSAVIALTQAGFTASVSQAANNDVCLTTSDTVGGKSVACAHAQDAAAYGITIADRGVGLTPRLTVLVPDGTSSVVFDAGANKTTGTVVNNVATSTLSGISGVSYAVPGGAHESYSIPAL